MIQPHAQVQAQPVGRIQRVVEEAGIAARILPDIDVDIRIGIARDVDTGTQRIIVVCIEVLDLHPEVEPVSIRDAEIVDVTEGVGLLPAVVLEDQGI